ncbi:MAG: DMT family transporter [Actinomycetota bacterium]|nr:DMT family transporter [Actinomycetota bacterium]
MRPGDAARLLLLGAIWGSSFLFIKLGLRAYTPSQIVAGRVVIGVAVLLFLLRYRGLSLPRGAATWRSLLFMAVVANLVPFLLITWGEERISSGLTAILNSTTPLFTAVLATVYIVSERLTSLRLGGIVLGFAGVGVIVGIEGGSLVGQVAVVLAALSYAVGFVYARSRLTGRSGSPLELSAGQLLVATILIVPVAGIDSIAHPLEVGLEPPSASVFALGFFGTGLAYVLYYRLITDVGATTASLVTYLITIFGAVFGWVALDERLGWNALVGAAMVIAGIAIAQRGAPPAEPIPDRVAAV